MSGAASGADAVVEPVVGFPKSTAGTRGVKSEVGPPKCAPKCEMNQTREQTRAISPRIKKEPEVELGAGLRPGEPHEVEFTR